MFLRDTITGIPIYDPLPPFPGLSNFIGIGVYFVVKVLLNHMDMHSRLKVLTVKRDSLRYHANLLGFIMIFKIKHAL